MEHEESNECWCCPSIEIVIDAAGEPWEFIIHHSPEEAN